jgi:aryl-alcohol dehydrogenase-like predicted oxidoreductase
MEAKPVSRRSLGPEIGEVASIGLGSWNTFSRLSRPECARLLREALDRGISYFDVGYYWDKPDTEEMFASALLKAGISRSRITLALKLWLWNYPEQSLAAQADASLARLGSTYADLVMVSRPTPNVDPDVFCAEIANLIESGRARAWGGTNWEPEQLVRARDVLPKRYHPRLVQLQYNVARRGVVESRSYQQLFGSQLGLCASFVLEGGILAGHLDRDRVNPSDFRRGERPQERNIARDAGGVRDHVRCIQPKLHAIAARFDATAAQLAIAFVLSNPATAIALIGVTRVEDLRENVLAHELLERRAEWLPELEALRAQGVGHPRLFDPQTAE